MGTGRGRRKGEVHGHLLLLQFDALHLLELLDAALHLGGLGILGAEAVDPLFSLFDLALLCPVLFLENLPAQGGFPDKERIIAGVLGSLSTFKGDGAGGKLVEKGAVVRNDSDSAPVVAQEALHPALGIDIEVVGGLIQQKDVGLLQEKPGHRDPHLPAAGKLTTVAQEVVPLKAQSLQDGLYSRLDAGGIKMLKLQFQFSDLLKEVGVGLGSRIEALKLMGKFVDLPLQPLGFGEGGLRFFPERVSGQVNAVLGQIADPALFGFGDPAAVRLDHARDALHEG